MRSILSLNIARACTVSSAAIVPIAERPHENQSLCRSLYLIAADAVDAGGILRGSVGSLLLLIRVGKDYHGQDVPV